MSRAILFFLLLTNSGFALTLQKEVVAATPFDFYLAPFHEVASARTSDREFTTREMEKWARRAHRIAYEHTGDHVWKSPEQVEQTSTGDCKEKALWLFSRLKSSGASSLEMVIGKRHLSDANFHAWIIVHHQGRTYLLDPAARGSVWETSDFEWDEYVPSFSYDGRRSFGYTYQAAAR